MSIHSKCRVYRLFFHSSSEPKCLTLSLKKNKTFSSTPFLLKTSHWLNCFKWELLINRCLLVLWFNFLRWVNVWFLTHTINLDAAVFALPMFELVVLCNLAIPSICWSSYCWGYEFSGRRYAHDGITPEYCMIASYFR